jgi:hypothetical protein
VTEPVPLELLFMEKPVRLVLNLPAEAFQLSTARTGSPERGDRGPVPS